MCGFVVAQILRKTIVKNELTLMKSSMMMMMILVNIKTETLMKKQMNPVTVVKTNCMKMMKQIMIGRKLYLEQKLTMQQILICLIGLLQPCIHSAAYIV